MKSCAAKAGMTLMITEGHSHYRYWRRYSLLPISTLNFFRVVCDDNVSVLLHSTVESRAFLCCNLLYSEQSVVLVGVTLVLPGDESLITLSASSQ